MQPRASFGKSPFFLKEVFQAPQGELRPGCAHGEAELFASAMSGLLNALVGNPLDAIVEVFEADCHAATFWRGILWSRVGKSADESVFRFFTARPSSEGCRQFGMKLTALQEATVVNGMSSAVATAVAPPRRSRISETVAMNDALR